MCEEEPEEEEEEDFLKGACFCSIHEFKKLC